MAHYFNPHSDSELATWLLIGRSFFKKSCPRDNQHGAAVWGFTMTDF